MGMVGLRFFLGFLAASVSAFVAVPSRPAKPLPARTKFLASLPEQIIVAKREADAAKRNLGDDGDATCTAASSSGEVTDDLAATAAAALASIAAVAVLVPASDLELLGMAAMAAGTLASQTNESSVADLARAVGKLGTSIGKSVGPVVARVGPTVAKTIGATPKNVLNATSPAHFREDKAAVETRPMDHPIPTPRSAAINLEAQAPADDGGLVRVPLKRVTKPRPLRAKEAEALRLETYKDLADLSKRETSLRREQTRIRTARAAAKAASQRRAAPPLNATDLDQQHEDILEAMRSLQAVRAALRKHSDEAADIPALAKFEADLRRRQGHLRAQLHAADEEAIEERNLKMLRDLDAKLTALGRQRQRALARLAHASVYRFA